MRVISEFTVPTKNGEAVIELLQGDLTAIPEEHAADILVISAFQDDYIPTPSSLIGALHRKGVSVAELARYKELDRRPETSCWLSRPLNRPDLNVRRIVCFEPSVSGDTTVADVVSDVFRMIIEIEDLEESGVKVCMPLLAAGDQGESENAMLRGILDAAVHWLSIGLNVDRLSIVLHYEMSQEEIDELLATFGEMAETDFDGLVEPVTADGYDYFISYSHKDSVAADELYKAIKEIEPEARIFVDRIELTPGSVWHSKIYEAIESSRKIIALLSPDYMVSKACQDEMNIALFRMLGEGEGLLFPIYLRTASLPARLQVVQYHNARETDVDQIRKFAVKVCESSSVEVHASAKSSPTRVAREEKVTESVQAPRSTLGSRRSVILVEGDLEIEITVNRREHA